MTSFQLTLFTGIMIEIPGEEARSRKPIRVLTYNTRKLSNHPQIPHISPLLLQIRERSTVFDYANSHEIDPFHIPPQEPRISFNGISGRPDCPVWILAKSCCTRKLWNNFQHYVFQGRSWYKFRSFLSYCSWTPVQLSATCWIRKCIRKFLRGSSP